MMGPDDIFSVAEDDQPTRRGSPPARPWLKTLSEPMLAEAIARHDAGDSWVRLGAELGVSYKTLITALARTRRHASFDRRTMRAAYEAEALPVMFEALREFARRLEQNPGEIKERDLNAFIGTTHDKVFGPSADLGGLLDETLAGRRFEIQELGIRLLRVLPAHPQHHDQPDT